jgi:glycerol kinase
MASHYDQWGDTKLHVKLALVVIVAALIVWHTRRPELHALEGAIFVASLVIVWLGVALAHGV